jgi:hypothetical protein
MKDTKEKTATVAQVGNPSFEKMIDKLNVDETLSALCMSQKDAISSSSLKQEQLSISLPPPSSTTLQSQAKTIEIYVAEGTFYRTLPSYMGENVGFFHFYKHVYKDGASVVKNVLFALSKMVSTELKVNKADTVKIIEILRRTGGGVIDVDGVDAPPVSFKDESQKDQIMGKYLQYMHTFQNLAFECGICKYTDKDVGLSCCDLPFDVENNIMHYGGEVDITNDTYTTEIKKRESLMREVRKVECDLKLWEWNH